MEYVTKDFGTEVDLKALDQKNTDYVEKAKKEETTSIVLAEGVWARYGEIYSPVEETVETLPAGNYQCYLTMSGIRFARMNPISDEIIRLPDEPSDDIIKSVDEFWNLKKTFDSLGFLHKRGYLLYGPQGGGKSVAIKQISDALIKEYDGIVLYPECSPNGTASCLSALRSIEKTRKICVVLEDIDDTIAYYGDKALTSLLDGENKVDNIVYLATTNYPERIPQRIINRPSRFDIVKYIGLPSTEARTIYLKAKAPTLSEKQVSEWVSKTEKFTLPKLKELIICVLAYMMPLDTAIEQISGLKKFKTSQSFDKV